MRKLVCLAALLAASAQAAPLQHTVVKGDHLWGLAGTYYKNNFRWKVIFSANQEKIKDPHWIYPGQVFVIPDVPGPEIGEVPARPVETTKTAQAVDAAAEDVLAGGPPPAAPAEKPAPKPEEPRAPRLEDAPLPSDDLSSKMPPQVTGQFPSMARVKAPAGWISDGRIVEFEGREILAAQGDSVNGKLAGDRSASVGDRFLVYRKDAPQETDEDQRALYLRSVGEVEVSKALGGAKYTFVVLKSGDSLQLGDLLKKADR